MAIRWSLLSGCYRCKVSEWFEVQPVGIFVIGRFVSHGDKTREIRYGICVALILSCCICIMVVTDISMDNTKKKMVAMLCPGLCILVKVWKIMILYLDARLESSNSMKVQEHLTMGVIAISIIYAMWFPLTHRGRVTYMCVSKISHQWFS